jgi:hypothetical protein
MLSRASVFSSSIGAFTSTVSIRAAATPGIWFVWEREREKEGGRKGGREGGREGEGGRERDECVLCECGGER